MNDLPKRITVHGLILLGCIALVLLKVTTSLLDTWQWLHWIYIGSAWVAYVILLIIRGVSSANVRTS